MKQRVGVDHVVVGMLVVQGGGALDNLGEVGRLVRASFWLYAYIERMVSRHSEPDQNCFRASIEADRLQRHLGRDSHRYAKVRLVAPHELDYCSIARHRSAISLT